MTFTYITGRQIARLPTMNTVSLTRKQERPAIGAWIKKQGWGTDVARRGDASTCPAPHPVTPGHRRIQRRHKSTRQ